MFGGNPAAMVLLDDWLPDRILAAIAAENNLSETAFVVARGDVMPLRWFTPTVEVDLCGHATLAAAHVLFRYSIPSAKSVTFRTREALIARDLLAVLATESQVRSFQPDFQRIASLDAFAVIVSAPGDAVD